MTAVRQPDVIDISAAATRRSQQTATATTLLRVDRVSKQFAQDEGVLSALEDCSLDVHRGEFVCLVGPSGCGKSTLLNMVGGLLEPTDGQVLLNGTPVSGPDEHMSYVFQQPVLLPWFSVIDNVLLPMRLAGRDSEEVRKFARALLTLVGLEGFERSFPRQLSGGMQQRAGFARALVTKPLIILMDEPFAALDALTREYMAVELQAIIAENEKTTLFVTHSISEAALLVDRVVVMSARPGRIIEQVPVPMPRPRTLAVTETPEYLEVVRRVREALERGNTTSDGRPAVSGSSSILND